MIVRKEIPEPVRYLILMAIAVAVGLAGRFVYSFIR